jgi:hypothetical protein
MTPTPLPCSTSGPKGSVGDQRRGREGGKGGVWLQGRVSAVAARLMSMMAMRHGGEE